MEEFFQNGKARIRLMCGILGFMARTKGGAVPLAKSLRRLGHRGPDSLSLVLSEGVGFGSARLAIIGGDSGQQPWVDNGSESMLVLNGEVFNWRALGENGATSDTAVVAERLMAEGAACLRAFRGGYALAFYDARDDSLLLARDQFGQKPLYVREQAQSIRFASEPAALFDDGETPRMDEAALSVLLRFQFLPPGTSLFKGIRTLKPGTFLKIQRRRDGRLEMTEGKIRWPHARSPHSIAENFAISCKRQVAGSEPSAILLSGGLDSTAVLSGLIAQGHRPQRAWVGYFPDGPESWDERPFAREAASRHGVDLEELAITPELYKNAIERCVAALGEPIAGPGSVSQFLLCERASADHRIVYGGQGGDELFGGYARLSLLQLLEKDGHDFDPAYEPLLRRMRRAKAQYPFDALAPYREAVDRGRALLPFASLYGQSLVAKGASVEACLGSEIPSDALGKAQLFEWRVLLPGLLQVDDRSCSAFGMEGRSPFLDQDLAAQLMGISLAKKSPAHAVRRLFKSELAAYLPPRIAKRRDKLGFPHPLLSWWHGPLRDWARDLLHALAGRERALIRPARIERMLTNDGQGGRLVYFLIMLELWQRAFIDQGVVAAPLDSSRDRHINIMKGAAGS